MVEQRQKGAAEMSDRARRRDDSSVTLVPVGHKGVGDHLKIERDTP